MIKMTKNLKMADVITHKGKFHADDVLATVIFSKLFGNNITVLRTFKVPEDVRNEVIVFDIGGGKFDHHQKGGNGTRENGVPYSSVGLIWKEFGHKLVADTCNPELVWSLIDRDLVQGVDAIDNGKMPKVDYPIQSMSFSQAISVFNPQWDSNEDSDEAFLKAVSFAEIVFDNALANAISKAKAQQIVDEAIEKSEEHIMILDRFVPWQEFIFSSANKKAEDILFVIFPSDRGGFNFQSVPDAIGSFGQRKSVPESWKGLSGEELQRVTGVETATFCHAAGFIGATGNLEDAVKMAKIAVAA